MPASRRRSPAVALLVAVLSLLVVLLVGVWLGGHPSLLPGAVRDTLVDDDEARALRKAVDLVHDSYYRKIPRDQLVDDSVQGLVQGLDDRFSNYFGPEQYRDFQALTDARFSGVGISVTPDPRGLRVRKVYARSPAAKGGLLAGDLVVAVDGRSLRGKPSGAASALIKGRPGTRVSLTVERGGRTRVVRLKRATIALPVVESRLRTVGGVKLAAVQLSGFTSGAHGELRGAIDRALRQGAEGIVLDMRGNGGGLLDEAVLISSIFIEDGTVVTTQGRTRKRRVYRAMGDAISEKVPVVVLVDRGSASASEIVAGALQDRKRAQIVGTRTFGKGVFQDIEELPNGGALELVVGQYFTPNGRNVGGEGAKPGSGLAPDVSAADRPRTPRDEALDVALGRLAREAR